MIVSNIQSLCQVTRKEVVVMCSIKEQYWPHSMESQLEWWERYTDKDDVFITLVNDGSILAFCGCAKAASCRMANVWLHYVLLKCVCLRSTADRVEGNNY